MTQLQIFQNESLTKFIKYNRTNPHLYEQFEKFAFEAINSGYKHFGPQMIIEKIRWETGVVAKDSEFKISNNCSAYYSRIFMLKYPTYASYFLKRSSPADFLTLEML